MPEQLADTEKVVDVLPLTSTVTDFSPLGWEITPRRGKEELPSVRLWVILPPMASESVQPG